LSSIIFTIQWHRYLDFDRVIAPIWNYPPLSKRAYNELLELLHIIHITVASISSQGSSYRAYEFKVKSTPDKLYTKRTKITTNAEIIILYTVNAVRRANIFYRLYFFGFLCHAHTLTKTRFPEMMVLRKRCML